MRGTLILITVFSVSTGKPATEERVTTTVTITGMIESTKFTTKENQVPTRMEHHATVKCEHIHPEIGFADRGNDGACETHCRIVATDYVGGECRDGVCHCRRDVGHGKRSWGADDPRPTVKCVDLIVDGEEERSENDFACQLHCKSLKNGYRRGECLVGICFCSQQI